MREFKRLSGKINIKKTDHVVGGAIDIDGTEFDNPFLSLGDKIYLSDTNKTIIEVRYYQSKQHNRPKDSRNIIFENKDVVTDAEIDLALEIYEPKSKGKPWEI